jgi:hypothetical protein
MLHGSSLEEVSILQGYVTTHLGLHGFEGRVHALIRWHAGKEDGAARGSNDSQGTMH